MTHLSQFSASLAKLCPHVCYNEPMANHTTFRVGGPAAMVARPKSMDQLVSILDLHRTSATDIPLCVLGNGSNVLFDDEGYRGLVLLTSHIRSVSFASIPNTEGAYAVTTDCGTSLTALAGMCIKDGRALRGLAFAYGIPGSVGGAVVMNAGAYGGEMSDVVSSVDYYDPASGTIRTAPREDLAFSYRHSIFSQHPELVVLRAKMLLPTGNAEEISAAMEANMAARKAKQPLELPNAGSVFKRPEGRYVGKMVEDCGLKGYSIGGAQISPKHAGFIVNKGNATARDILALMDHIKDVIRKSYGIDLVCEIRHITDR